MFVELNPGSRSAPVVREHFTLPIANTLPDVNPDEILSALDSDTRDYLKLLLKGASEGLDGRGDDLREALRRFEPTYRDLALVSGEARKRHRELRRLIHALNRLNAHLSTKDTDLAELVGASSQVFRAIASERGNVTATIHELPSTLLEAEDALARVERMGIELGPTVERLRPVMRELRKANEATAPFARATAPLLEKDIRPFVREARPLVRELRPAVGGLVDAEPDLTRVFTVVNRFFNMLGHNPGGREAPDKAARDEGYLFYSPGWATRSTTSSQRRRPRPGPSGDHGRHVCRDPEHGRPEPELEALLGLTGALTDDRICGKAAG